MATETETAEEDLAVYERWTRTAMRDSDRVYRALFYVTVVFFLVVMLFPFYWLFVLALTPNDLIINMGVVPRGFNVEAFVQVFEMVPFHRYVFNSFVLALSTTAIVLLIGSLAGYVFGRLEFPGRQPLMLLILAISYFPPAAFLLPLFDLFTGNVELFGIQSPQLFNTPSAMVLPFSSLFLPLAIFILATFYSQIPDGLEDVVRMKMASGRNSALNGSTIAVGVLTSRGAWNNSTPRNGTATVFPVNASNSGTRNAAGGKYEIARIPSINTPRPGNSSRPKT